MLVEYQCPCDMAFGTRHRRNFAIEGDLQRLDSRGLKDHHDWRRHCEWLTSEGPAVRLWIEGVEVWSSRVWLVEEARSSCIERTNAFLDYLQARPLVSRARGEHP